MNKFLTKSYTKKDLTFKYMLAMSIMFILSIVTLISLLYTIKQQQHYASIINLSGRQRMLSQKTMLMICKLTSETNKSEIEKYSRKLEDSLKLMENSHTILVSGKLKNGNRFKLSDKINEMYLGEELNVNNLIHIYIKNLRFLMDKNCTSKLSSKDTLLKDEMFNMTLNQLLPNLDKIVKQYEKESQYYSNILVYTQVSIFLFTLISLICTIILIFKPMVASIVINENVLNSILDNIPVYMDIVNYDAEIMYQSEFLQNAIGRNVVGEKCFNIYKDNKEQCKECPLNDSIKGLSKKAIEVSDCLGGKVLEISHIDILFRGKEAILEVFQDVTQQRETEKLLIVAKEEAENASKMKSEFLASMSHEIRTPLNGIIGFTEMAFDTNLSEEQQEYMRHIKISGETLLSLINDILDFSKVEAGRLELEQIECSLNQIIDNTIVVNQSKLTEKGLCFNIDVPQFDYNIISDPVRLQQILTNLISNAVKFTSAGEIKLQIIVIEETKDSLFIEFAVTDTGIGIPRNKLKHIFTAFSQADSTVTRKFGGTGLGLTISNKLVDLLGGTNLEVASEIDKGSTFSFKLNFKLGSKIKKKIKKELDPSKKVEIEKLDILLVEDNDVNIKLATKMLTNLGHDVMSAKNGELGVEAIKKENYDLILMDMMMPVMDGLTATRAIREYENSNNIEQSNIIVAMTANAMTGDKQRCIDAGMNDYISKPFNKKMISSLIEKIFSL